ncbi:Plastin-2 [Trichinella pseudospiralis]|uniref:Plastin-2 n=2 Tax=Trichinella pseudospiralis TaxID=6337 RepID=A0A0V1EKQ2_TRIPS|nr:Plastin-2 [Trichinella pseudospiralis]
MPADCDRRLSQSLGLTEEQLTELSNSFETIDINGDGAIQLSELQRAFEAVGLKLPSYQVRDLIREHFPNYSTDASLSVIEFAQLFAKLKEAADPKFKKRIQKAENVHVLGGLSEASQEQGIYHSVRTEEQVAFSDWINSNLSSDRDLMHLLPLTKSGDDLYQKMVDGLIICKLINLAVPETIDERAINRKNLNTYTKRENLTLAVNSARAIGCNIVNIDADDLAKGKPHLVLGLLWQIIRIGRLFVVSFLFFLLWLFSQIDLVHVPGLFRLLDEGENLNDLQRLSPEQILMRWVNYHLQQAGVSRKLNNFTTDVQDSFIYTHLLKQIAPPDRNVTLDPLRIQNSDLERAESMLREADKLDCRAFVTAQDVINGVYKLNLAFVAHLFNTWPGLKPPGEEELDNIEEILEETREERTYRNWMNSVGVSPTVNWLYSDLCSGLIIFQLYDVIEPGLVDWKHVVKKFTKMDRMMNQIQNCNYAVDLGKRLRFSLVGIQGKDIYDGNRTLSLALIWQLMRAYTLTILANCTQSGSLATDKEILDWVNNRLKESGKTLSISGFQDSKISDAKVVIDLIDAIQPGVIQYDLIKSGVTFEEKMDNAKYAISIARKIGAKIYALPEDIVECKPKMVMTVFACLMARDYVPNMRKTVSEKDL